MKERIGQIARGEIKYEKPKLLLEPENISETLVSGFVYHRELHLISANRIPARGLIYSNQKQVTAETNQFAGSRCYIKYAVDTTEVRPGGVIAGAFHVVSCGSEFDIPYHFEVSAAEGVDPEVQSFDELYELAMKDERKAVSVFAAPRFKELPFLQELHCYALYESLMKSGTERTALWAFLRGMGYEVTEKTEQEGADSVSSPDRTKTRYSSLEGLSGRENYRQLMDLLLEYQCGKYAPERLLPELEKEAVRLVRVYPDETLPVLMRAYFALQGGYRAAASKLLEDAYHTVLDRRRMEPVNYCLYLFLRTLVGTSEEQKQNIIKLLDKYYQELNYPLGLLFFVLYVDQNRSRDIAAVLRLLKEAYNRGLHSPFLYAEAMKWLALRPELLTALDDFEWDCLRFSVEYGAVKPASRKDMRHQGSRVLRQASYERIQITEELALRVAALAVEDRHFKEENLKLLVQLYEAHPSGEVLRAIVMQLLFGRQRDPKWFCWYQKAIEEGLQFMGLYEAYIASMPGDFDGMLPKELVVYYSFHNELPEELKEILYANILRCYQADSREYEEYREQMEQYAIVRLLKGQISPYLAPIYQHVIHQEMVDERLSTVLPDLIYAKRIRCPKAGMVRLLVRYPEFASETGYEMNGGFEVCCPVYTPDALLIFVDAKGRRQVFPETTVQPLMEDHGLIERCRQWNGMDPMLNLLALREAMDRTVPEEGDWGLLSAACADAQLHPNYRRKIVSHIMNQWEHFRREGDAIDFLRLLDASSMSRKERARYVGILVEEGQAERAYGVVEACGYTGVSSDVLIALMQGLLAEDEETFRPVVLELCLSLYKREKADASMMGYLCRYYNGSTSQMLSVLEKTCSLCGNVKDMPERLLAQMLFAEQTEKLDFVFSVYSAQEQLYHILVQAYFVWKSYRGFAVGEAMPDYFFGFLERYYKQSAFQQEGKVLAGAWLLEHLTKQEEPDLELVQQITDFLCEEHRCFAFYQALPEGVRLPESLNGCMILEYRSDQPGEYYVQYDRYPGGVNSGLLKMHAMCQGVYAEPVMIFPGETLTVTYLRRYQGEEELLVCGQQLPYHKVFSIPGSLYDSLNQICTLLEKKTQASDQAAEEALTQMRIREKMLTCLMHEGQKGENET